MRPNDKIELLQGDCLELLKTLNEHSIDSVVTDPPYGINFMGKKWDYNLPNVEVWQEVLRVLKPGGHALVACGTRTQHRMAVNLEDAGFEIRDLIAWVYGSGFPKSQNIGKAVDKLQGNERQLVEKKPAGYAGLKRNANLTDYNWKGITEEDTGLEVTKGNSKHEGWGTALKPAMELWTLVRKPLEERTIAKNVLKYNTGGINIDACRVQGQYSTRDRQVSGGKSIFKTGAGGGAFIPTSGRFPTNLIHDGSDEVVNKFPETKSGGGDLRAKNSSSLFNPKDQRKDESLYKANKGSASRFFYCAKASKSKRNKGLEEFKEHKIVTFATSNGTSGKASSISEGRNTVYKNNHPTVKPIKLMKYLCRLITPKEGKILDPYMGSGSTGIAAKDEGFNFTGIELDKDYFEIAKARINSKEKQ